MGTLANFPVLAFTEDHVSNPYPEGELPWQVYQSVRNSIVEVCRRFGTTGPMGLVKIVDDVSDPYVNAIEPGFWELGDEDPAYYVIDDQYNSERYCYAELYRQDAFNASWLSAIVDALQRHQGWALGINLPNHHVLIFGTGLMVRGPQLRKCKSAAEVIESVRRLLVQRDK
jgi:hypothetical protein